MDSEIEKMNEEIIELREDNQRLHKMCLIVEQMNDLLNEAINECKCFSGQTFETKTKNKLNILKQKYKQLKDTEIHFTQINGRTKDLSSVSIHNKLGVKMVSIDENSDNFETNSETINEKQKSVTIEAIDETGEEVNIELILPKIVANDQHFQEFSETKPMKTIVENKNQMIRRTAIKSHKTKEGLKPLKRSNIMKKRGKRVSCDWPGCQMKFRDSYNMSVHLVRHTGQKSFACCNPGCFKSYATKAALEVHHNSHLDNRRFKCPYSECSAAFIRKTQLKVHISQSHTHDFPYKCNWPGCEYQGCYLNRLNSHRLSHTGIKPFKCEWKGCDANFRLNHHLKAHMLKHTGEKPIPCQLSDCDKRFQSKQAMKLHFERTHSKPALRPNSPILLNF